MARRYGVLLSPNKLAGLCVAIALLPATASSQSPPVTASTELDAIVVTARKVEENPQDIPISMQVLWGDFLDSVDVTRLFDLQFNIPGLVVNSVGMFGAGFALRGIASQSGTGDAVAVHMNGVYLGNGNLAIARMFDLERIEVLKGPQGTLYGRNSTAGSVNLISRPPADSFSAGVEAGYGSFATTRMQGHLNLPLQSAAIRLAFIASEGDGYIRNSIDDRKFAEEDFWGVRGAWRFDAGERLEIDLMAQRIRDDGASGEVWGPNPAYLVDPEDIRLTTVTQADPYLVTVNDVASLDLRYALGRAALRSITGYARNETNNLDDCAGLPILQGCVRGVRPLKYSQWSQELQLVLPATDLVEALVGMHYLESDRVRDYYQHIPVRGPRPSVDQHTTDDERVVGIFGQASVKLAARWTVTGGLRLSHEESRVSTIGTGIDDSPMLLRGKIKSEDVSWRLDIEHAASDDLLLYAGVSTGYKSGGLSTTPLPDGELDNFGPEDLVAYEAGAKSQWLDRRLALNAAAFWYDFRDLQVSTVGERLLNEVDNAARARLYGIDAEGVYRVSERVVVSAGVVWLPVREYVEFRNLRTGDTLSGNKLVRAPEWTTTAAIEYGLPVFQLGWLSTRLEYHYRSSYFFTKENDPAFSQDSFGLLNLFLRFEPGNGGWYAFASGRNLTDEDYFNQVFLQSSPGYPDTYEIGFGYRF
jgi:iron complex outermembrane recepter protein